MTRTTSKLVAIGILLAVPLFGWVGIAQAQGFRTGDNLTVGSGETVDSSLYLAGRTIDIAGTVNGDVFCAGQNVTISGTVSGDVICAGQSVRITGNVEGDIRVAGQNVTVGSVVGGSLSALGQTLNTEASSRVGGDAGVAGQDVALNGAVGRDLAIASENATVNSQVGRNVRGEVTYLTLGDSANIGGDVQYTSKNTLSRSSGAEVAGQVSRTEPTEAAKQQDGGSDEFWFAVWFFVSMLLIALAVALLMPRTLWKASEETRRRLGRTLLVGLIAAIVVPILIFTLMFTVVGIPLAIVLFMAWAVVAVLAFAFAAFLLGSYLLRSRSENAALTMLAGAALLLLVYMVPVLGWIVGLIALWWGLGMVLIQLFHARKAQSEPVRITPADTKPDAGTDAKPEVRSVRKHDAS